MRTGAESRLNQRTLVCDVGNQTSPPGCGRAWPGQVGWDCFLLFLFPSPTKSRAQGREISAGHQPSKKPGMIFYNRKTEADTEETSQLTPLGGARAGITPGSRLLCWQIFRGASLQQPKHSQKQGHPESRAAEGKGQMALCFPFPSSSQLCFQTPTVSALPVV